MKKINCLFTFILGAILSISLGLSSCGKSEKSNSSSNVMKFEQNNAKETDSNLTDVEKFVYNIFYDSWMIDPTQHPEGINFYTPSMLEKFKQYNITSPIPEEKLYSNNWKSIEKNWISAQEKLQYDMIGFDVDIIWDAQDYPTDSEIEIVDVSPVKMYEVKVKLRGFDKSFIIIQENGEWKIDDIDGIKKDMLKETGEEISKF